MKYCFATVLLSLSGAAACSLVNSVDADRIGRAGPKEDELDEVACADGRDNDQDGAFDCEDAGCALHFACFTRGSFVRPELCPALARGAKLEDEFDAASIDPELWTVFNTDARDAPRIVDGGLDPNGVDNYWQSGVASRGWFTIGREQMFRLELSLRPLEGCDRRGPSGATCMVRMALDTRVDWGDGSPFGDEVLGLWAQVEAGEDGAESEVSFAAFYHRIGSAPIAGARRPYRTGDPYRVAIALDGATGEAVFELDGEEVARTPVRALEPSARLVLWSQLDRLGPGAMIVDAVRLETQPEREKEACAGRTRGAPVLAGAFCDSEAFYNTGIDRVRVARGPAGYEMLFSGSYALNRLSLGRATSGDGTTWSHATPDAATLAADHLLRFREIFQVAAAGQLLYDAERARFETWTFEQDPNEGVRLKHQVAPQNDPTAWRAESSIALDGELAAGPGGPHQLRDIVPDMAVVRRAGEYLGYYVAPMPDGRSAVFAIRSDDGARWSLVQPAPVLSPDRDAFDADGITAVSVTDTGGFIALVYAGRAFGARTALGLAASLDGINFLKHEANPLVVPEQAHVDELGTVSPALLIEDQKLRIWYSADRPSEDCAIDQLDLPSRRGAAFVELTARNTEHGAAN